VIPDIVRSFSCPETQEIPEIRQVDLKPQVLKKQAGSRDTAPAVANEVGVILLVEPGLQAREERAKVYYKNLDGSVR
jgi:hypothetical protein